MIGKTAPLRSPAFMAFCHEEMKPAPCCICQQRPWVALHHFGDDGGQSLKPSDNEVARCCTGCHMEWDRKRRGLLKMAMAHPDDPRPMDILDRFQNDALKLNRAYIEYLEKNKSRTSECAVDELVEWLATEPVPIASLDRYRNWLLSWADRRAAAVIEDYYEDGVEDGQDEDRLVR